MILDALVGEGERIPWGYGISYRDFERDTKVAYPLGIHFLVRWARDFRFWLMTVGRPGYRERYEQAVYHLGVEQGRRYEAKLRQMDLEAAYRRGRQ